jgi:hypothetical protein
MDRLFSLRITLVDVYGKTGFAIETTATNDRPVQVVTDASDLAVLIENFANYYKKQKEEAHPC